jgi:hypothetical protein
MRSFYCVQILVVETVKHKISKQIKMLNLTTDSYLKALNVNIIILPHLVKHIC